MDIAKLFSLPAHPLLVHIPIVLIPLVSIAGVLLAFVPKWRRPYGPVTVVLAAVALVGVQLAIGSGQQLQSHVPRTALLERHTSMADSLRPLAALLLVALLALVLADRYQHRPDDATVSRRRTPPAWMLTTLAVITVLAGVVASVRLIQIGHSGAKATWSTTDMSTPLRR